MRLRGFRIDAYGALRDVHVEGLAGHDVIVLHGANESGKSTVRDFVATGFFGFSPASRDGHPYAPADGLFGGALFLDDDGTAIAVERHLRSAPRGRIWRPDRHDDIGNRPIPAAAAVGRRLYAALHQLVPDDVTVISPLAWAAVEDRMLSGSAIAYLRSVAVVRRELDERALGLWRPDRRGQPVARALETEIAGLRQAAREADGDRRRMDELEAELAGIEADEQELRRELDRELARRRRHERLAPAVRARAGAEELRGRADALLPVDDLPADPGAELTRLSELRADAEAERSRADGRLAALHARMQVDPGVEAKAEGAPALREAAGLAAGLEALRARLATAERESESRMTEADRRARALLGRPLEPGDRAALEDVDTAALVAALARLGAGRRPSATPASRRTAVPAGLAAAAFAVAAALGLAPLASLLAAVALAAVAIGAVRGRGGAESAAAHAALRAALGGLPVSEARLAAADAALAGDVDLLMVAVADADRAIADARILAEELSSACARIERAAGSADPTEVGRALSVAEQASEQVRDAARASADLPSADAEREAVVRRLLVLAEAHQALAGRLEHVGAGDAAEGVRRVAEARRLRAHAEARESAEDADGMLDERLTEARSAPDAVLGDADLDALERRVADATTRLERLQLRRGELLAERRALSGRPGMADAEGAVAVLTERLEDVLAERDRLALAAAVLGEAERRYRETNGPRFAEAAGAYLETITGGRYRRILVGHDGVAQRLEVVREGEREPIPVGHPLSRGTLEQVHLALRLALVDEVDPERILPLFLDESLVHWDDQRVGAVASLLGHVGGRQVLVATCHASIAARLAAVGAYVLEMGGDGAALSPASSSTAIP